MIGVDDGKTVTIQGSGKGGSVAPGWHNASDDGRSYPKGAAQKMPTDFDPQAGPMPAKA